MMMDTLTGGHPAYMLTYCHNDLNEGSFTLSLMFRMKNLAPMEQRAFPSRDVGGGWALSHYGPVLSWFDCIPLDQANRTCLRSDHSEFGAVH